MIKERIYDERGNFVGVIVETGAVYNANGEYVGWINPVTGGVFNSKGEFKGGKFGDSYYSINTGFIGTNRAATIHELLGLKTDDEFFNPNRFP
jgi:hypothetical protein